MIRHGLSYSTAEVMASRPMGISAPTPWGLSELHRLHARSGTHTEQTSPAVPAIRSRMGKLTHLPPSPQPISKPFYP